MEPHLVALRAKTIFSLPEVVFKVNELVNSGDATNTELEKAILNDPALTAKLLKLANSALFGFSKNIVNMSHAITLIGHSELRNVALASAIPMVFGNTSSDTINMDAFWYHSVGTGVIARLLAYDVGSRERLFIAGLLHGIGKLILYSQFPEASDKILRLQQMDEKTIANLEQQTFGFTHAELSAEFLKEWHLPTDIWKTVAFQLDPENAEQSNMDAHILHFAVNLARYMQNHRNQQIDYEELFTLCEPEVYEYLNLDTETVELVNSVAEFQINEMLHCITDT